MVIRNFVLFSLSVFLSVFFFFLFDFSYSCSLVFHVLQSLFFYCFITFLQIGVLNNTPAELKAKQRGAIVKGKYLSRILKGLC